MAATSREARKSRLIQRLRWVLLLAMFATVATVVVLLVRGRSLEEPPPAEEIAEGELERSEGMITVGEGFERTVSEGDRALFTVRGDRFALDRDQKVYLEGVAITIYGNGESAYELEGPEGVFDPEKREARLSGGIELSGPDGFFLQTQGLQVIQRGRQVISTSDVYFKVGDRFHGRSDRLRVLLRARRYHLIGHARIETLEGAAEPFRLTTRLLTIDRSRHLIEGDDGPVELINGQDWLSATNMVVFLDEAEERIQYLRARERVVAQLRSARSLGRVEGAGVPGILAEPDLSEPDDSEEPDGARIGRVRIHTESMDLEFVEGTNQPKEIHLEGGPSRGRAVLRSFVVNRGPIHRLRAPRIDGVFEEGRPARFEAAEDVELAVIERAPLSIAEEIAEEAEADGQEGEQGAERSGRSRPISRTARGRRAEATFDATGRLASVSLFDRVVVDDLETRAQGDVGVFQTSDDSFELTGTPATLVSPRGDMEAPKLAYTRGDGILRGTGGVRARLADAGETSLAGSPLAEGDEPVWVEAERGFFREAPRSFLFQGEVRAWRGENLLTAEELRGDDAEERLSAKGDVRTLWIPEERKPLDAGEGEASAGEEGGGGEDRVRRGGPIEVTADEMVYLQGSRLLEYMGQVVAEQEKRVLACQEMDLMLSPEGSDAGLLEKLVCAGDVRITDPGSDEGKGRTLAGDRAVYDPASRVVEVSSEPQGKVTMEDGEGNVLEGPRMIFEIDQDRVRVLAPEEAAPVEDGAVDEPAEESTTAGEEGAR